MWTLFFAGICKKGGELKRGLVRMNSDWQKREQERIIEKELEMGNREGSGLRDGERNLGVEKGTDGEENPLILQKSYVLTDKNTNGGSVILKVAV